MTTLEEFKSKDRETGGSYIALVERNNELADLRKLALPALIAGAEGMAEALEQATHAVPPSVTLQIVEQALAAYEAWEMQIEGGDDA